MSSIKFKKFLSLFLTVGIVAVLVISIGTITNENSRISTRIHSSVGDGPMEMIRILNDSTTPAFSSLTVPRTSTSTSTSNDNNKGLKSTTTNTNTNTKRRLVRPSSSSSLTAEETTEGATSKEEKNVVKVKSSSEHPNSNESHKHKSEDHRNETNNSIHIRRRRRRRQTQKNEYEYYQYHPPNEKRILSSSFSDFVASLMGYNGHGDHDEIVDADADDYYKTMSVLDQYKDNNSNSNRNENNDSMEGTPWYALSHYIPPNTVLYDTIEGFFIAVLFCLVVATCYTHLYYCCFTRCGLCPDDRIYKSLLHREGRKRRRRVIMPRGRRRRRNMMMKKRRQMDNDNKNNTPCCSLFGGGSCCLSSCCCCCFTGGDGDYGRDGRGYFVPLSTAKTTDETPSEEDSNDDDSSSESSSLSQDSALSLEYGDDHLADEYGEVTDRLTDSKVQVAAKNFFDNEEKMTELENKKQKEAMKRQRRMRRNYGGSRSIASRSTRRSRRGMSAKSQASSILSSESESLSSYHSSSSDDEEDDHSLEMESAMMELELTGRRVNDAQM